MVMHIAVFSDTHGNTKCMREAIQQKDPFDMLIHLGDGVGDGLSVSSEFGIPFRGVYGNEDYAYRTQYSGETLVNIYSWSFVLVHGHQMDINPYHTDAEWQKHLRKMTVWAKRRKAHVFLFGHTHTPLLEQQDDVIVCNPGDMYLGAGTPPGFALIDAREEMLTLQIMQKGETGEWDIVSELERHRSIFS